MQFFIASFFVRSSFSSFWRMILMLADFIGLLLFPRGLWQVQLFGTNDKHKLTPQHRSRAEKLEAILSLSHSLSPSFYFFTLSLNILALSSLTMMIIINAYGLILLFESSFFCRIKNIFSLF
jgi:hypothetical protein